MSLEKELSASLKEFGKRKVETFSAEVVSVQKDQGTCTVSDGELEYDEVRLSAVINGRKDAYYLFPKVGSSVLVSPIFEDLNNLYVEEYSEVETLQLNIGSTAFKVDQKGFVIANGNENLVGVLTDTIDELTKTFTQNGLTVNIPAFELLKTRLKTILNLNE